MNIMFQIVLVVALIFMSCTKDKPPCPPTIPEPEVWEKFIGEYNVYDTNGVFLYQMEIINIYHDDNNDSLVILNFNQNFDFKFQFINPIDKKNLNIGSYDSIKDYSYNSWTLSSLGDDATTNIMENHLVNDTIVLFFRQTNIQYWVNEGVPYYYCDCKQIAVKQ